MLSPNLDRWRTTATLVYFVAQSRSFCFAVYASPTSLPNRRKTRFRSGELALTGWDSNPLGDSKEFLNFISYSIRPSFLDFARRTSSRPREFHPQPLTEPCLKVSLHTAPPTHKSSSIDYHLNGPLFDPTG